MNFRRIEWIFFVVFLGLNFFLLYIYQQGIQEQQAITYSNQMDSIETRLTADDIQFEGAFSTEKKEGYYLSAEETDFADLFAKNQTPLAPDFWESEYQIEANLLQVWPKKAFFLDEDALKQNLTDFLTKQNMVLFGEEYVYLSDFSMTMQLPELVAGQVYKNIPFKDDTAQLVVYLDQMQKIMKIKQYAQTHIHGIEELRDKMDLYSEREAIETLYLNNKIPSHATIRFTKLAYTRIYKVREKNVYVPVWFVGIQGKENENLQIEQVNAMNNTVVTNNVVTKVEK